MLDLFFVLRSVTYAQRGRDVLAEAGIRCGLHRAPGSIARSGCAYALAAAHEDGAAAAAALRSARIPYAGPFIRSKNGEYREISI